MPSLLALLALPSLLVALTPSALATSGDDDDQVCQTPSPEAFVKTFLEQNDYDATLAPGLYEGTGPTTVEVQFYMAQITDINEKAGSLVVIGYFRIWWNDPRLAFNTTGPCGDNDWISMRNEYLKKIWKPELYIDNLVARERDSKLDQGNAILVYSDGRAYSTSFRVLNVYNSFQLDDLPVDSHLCNIKVGAFSQDTTEVVLQPRDGSTVDGPSGVALQTPPGGVPDLKYFIGIGERNKTWATSGLVSTENGHSYVTLRFPFQRKVGYYAKQFIYPSILFLCIAYLQFWVPAAQTPARALLATLPVLIFNNLSNGLYGDLPKGSQTMALSLYLNYSLYVVVIAAVQFAGVQALTLVEARRRDRRNAVIAAKGAITKMAEMAKTKKVAMKHLLKEFMPDTLEKQVADDQKEEISKTNSGRKSFEVESQCSSMGDAKSGDTDQRQQAIREAGFKEKDIVILRIALQYFEAYDDDKSGDLGVTELRKVFSRFDWYLSTRQLAAAACAFARDRGRPTPEVEANLEMKFITFAPFMVEAESYMKLFQVALPAKGFREFFTAQSPSVVADKVARWVYPAICLALWVRLGYFVITRAETLSIDEL